jgi:hypothetical protein
VRVDKGEGMEREDAAAGTVRLGDGGLFLGKHGWPGRVSACASAAAAAARKAEESV